jgi:hypothetical protein
VTSLIRLSLALLGAINSVATIAFRRAIKFFAGPRWDARSQKRACIRATDTGIRYERGFARLAMSADSHDVHADGRSARRSHSGNFVESQEFGNIYTFQRERKNMRNYLAIAAAAATISTVAIAQPANRDANTPAINSPNSPPNPGAPAAGANSFTEGQAKSRIESNGYANVSELRKDEQGVWRGKAMKDGKSVNVSLDFQGNVTAQ